MNNKRKIEVNLVDLFYYLRKKIWIILAVCVVFALAGAVFTTFFMEDEYTATTRIYVLNRSSEALSSSDYSVANYLVSDYTVLITDENVTDEVIKQLGLDMTSSDLESMISVSAIDSTRILQIEVVDTDPQRAADIANCVREIASRRIKEIMNVDAVNLVREASVPQTKSGPSLTKNTALCGIVGLILILGILVVIYAVDDSIRTEEDVERYLGLSVFGVIPESSSMNQWNTGKKSAGKFTQKKKGGSHRGN